MQKSPQKLGEIGFKAMQFEKTLKTSNIVQEVNVNITTKYIH